MAVSSVFAFWAVSVLLIVVPGADWAFTIGAALGGRSVIPAVGGLVIGYAVITAVVAAGVGALVAESPAILIGLSIVGGVYLMWHGAMTFAGAGTPSATPEAQAASTRSTLVKGIGVSGLNPKGLLLFFALLPQFTDPRWRWPVAGQIGLLGLAFMLSCAAFYLCLGLLARTVLSGRPAAGRVIGRVSGAAMVAIGMALAADRLVH